MRTASGTKILLEPTNKVAGAPSDSARPAMVRRVEPPAYGGITASLRQFAPAPAICGSVLIRAVETTY
jgi:hypothetical protein